MNVKQTIKDLKVKFPNINKISIEYIGSGDSFEDFWNLETTPESDIEQSDIEDLLWYAIDNSDANFNSCEIMFLSYRAFKVLQMVCNCSVISS